MCSLSHNKLIAVSFALAAAGILACAGALLDTFIPRGSVLGFLAWLAVMGSVVIGTVVGYTWICDKCESYFLGRFDRLLNGSKSNRDEVVNPRAAVSQRPTEPSVVCDVRPTPISPQPLSRNRYVPTLRGADSRKDATKVTMARAWHGQ